MGRADVVLLGLVGFVFEGQKTDVPVGIHDCVTRKSYCFVELLLVTPLLTEEPIRRPKDDCHCQESSTTRSGRANPPVVRAQDRAIILRMTRKDQGELDQPGY